MNWNEFKTFLSIIDFFPENTRTKKSFDFLLSRNIMHYIKQNDEINFDEEIFKYFKEIINLNIKKNDEENSEDLNVKQLDKKIDDKKLNFFFELIRILATRDFESLSSWFLSDDSVFDEESIFCEIFKIEYESKEFTIFILGIAFLNFCYTQHNLNFDNLLKFIFKRENQLNQIFKNLDYNWLKFIINIVRGNFSETLSLLLKNSEKHVYLSSLYSWIKLPIILNDYLDSYSESKIYYSILLIIGPLELLTLSFTGDKNLAKVFLYHFKN